MSNFATERNSRLMKANIENIKRPKVSSIKYNSIGEVVFSELRLLESEQKKLSKLRNALIEGENSPKVEDFNAQKHLADLHRKYL